MEVRPENFSEALFEKLKKEAANFKEESGRRKFDSYSYFTKPPRRINNAKDFWETVSIAYSWMPTMLDIYEPENVNEDLIGRIAWLKDIQDTHALKSERIEIIRILNILKDTINNSIIGTSKVLHMCYPLHIPIFDSRTIAAWNRIFESAENKIPTLNKTNQAEVYFNYWLGLFYWRENIEEQDVRQIEKPLFEYGKYLAWLEKEKRKAEKLEAKK